MASNLPSGYKESKAKQKQDSYLEHVKFPSVAAQNSNFLAYAAIVIAIIALLLSIYTSSGIPGSTKAELKAISADLRTIQQKEIVLTSPLKASVLVDQSFPASDIFPDTFNLYVDDTIPLDSQITARSNTGQIVVFNVADDLHVKSQIPIDSNKSLAGVNVRINREIPIDTQFSATLKVNAVYGKELNDIIERLDKLSGDQ
ncbi:MAG: hypothetical protein V1822_03040 [Candidatus Micrarchaeota archaeon]